MRNNTRIIRGERAPSQAGREEWLQKVVAPHPTHKWRVEPALSLLGNVSCSQSSIIICTKQCQLLRSCQDTRIAGHVKVCQYPDATACKAAPSRPLSSALLRTSAMQAERFLSAIDSRE